MPAKLSWYSALLVSGTSTTWRSGTNDNPPLVCAQPHGAEGLSRDEPGSLPSSRAVQMAIRPSELSRNAPGSSPVCSRVRTGCFGRSPSQVSKAWCATSGPRQPWCGLSTRVVPAQNAWVGLLGHARMSSGSQRRRAEAARMGTAKAPQPTAAWATWVNRESGTGPEVKRRRSVQRRLTASNTSAESREGTPRSTQMFASRSGSSGLGVRSTFGVAPSARPATTRWCRAAPQLIARFRPSGSAIRDCRSRSAHSSMLCSLLMPGPGLGVVDTGSPAREVDQPLRQRLRAHAHDGSQDECSRAGVMRGHRAVVSCRARRTSRASVGMHQSHMPKPKSISRR